MTMYNMKYADIFTNTAAAAELGSAQLIFIESMPLISIYSLADLILLCLFQCRSDERLILTFR